MAQDESVLRIYRRDREIMAIKSLRANMQDYLNQFKGKTVLFWPNPGNAGDAVIQAATMQAMRRADIEVELLTESSNPKGRVVFIGGGGNFIPLYRDVRDIIKFSEPADHIIVLPHTIRGNEDVLKNFTTKVTIFCRDMESCRWLRLCRTSAEIIVDHDMAFHLDAIDLLTDISIYERSEVEFSRLLASHDLNIGSLCEPEILKCFRDDDESSFRDRGPSVDLSNIFKFWNEPSMAEISAWCLLNSLRIARQIETDRLHIGIGCILVGTYCRMHDNMYGKNEGVFRRSMDGRGFNLNFISADRHGVD